MAGFGQSRERAERLLALAALLRQGRPLTLAELRDRHRLYAGADESARRAFERDKAELRSLGVDIGTVDVDGTPAYWVTGGGARRSTVSWSDEELDTLAVLTTAIGDDASGVALAKLAAATGEFPADGAGATITTSVSVPDAVAEALHDRLRLALRYRDAAGALTDRVVEPWSLQQRSGLVYLAAWDPDAGAERKFRLDRIVEVSGTDGPAQHDRPDGPLSPVYPDERMDLRLRAPAELRHDVVVAGGTVESREGDWLEVLFAEARPEAVLGWSLRHGAVVLDPPDHADEQRRRLRRLAERHSGQPTEVERPQPARVRRATLSPVRLQRLLALPTWLGERAGVTRDEVAAAFSCSVEDITEDLELLDLVDLPGIGSIGEVVETDDGQIQYLRFVEEPTVELTAADALRLLLVVETGAIVLSAEEAPALASIAARLREIVPAEVQVELVGQDHADLAVLQEAIRDGAALRFQYRGRRDTTWRDRQVMPTHLQVANGAVYVAGLDVLAGEERLFRLDRLSDVEVTGTQPAMAAEASPPTYTPTAEEVEVLLLLSARATWLLTQVSASAIAEHDDGGAVVLVDTDTTAWLAAHVMAAGGEAEVIGPPELRSAVAETAASLLAAHGDTLS